MKLWQLLIAITLSLALVSCPARENNQNNGGGNTQQPSDNPAENELYSTESGEVVTVEVGESKITYALIDGLAVYQGDMILGTPAETRELLESVQDSNLSTAGLGLISTSRRWQNGIVPYVIDESTYNSQELSKLRETILRVQAHYIEVTTQQVSPKPEVPVQQKRLVSLAKRHVPAYAA